MVVVELLAEQGVSRRHALAVVVLRHVLRILVELVRPAPGADGGVVIDVVDLAVGVQAAQLLHLLGRDGCEAADVDALEVLQTVERGYVGQIIAHADVQMPQLMAFRQRGDVVNIREEHLEILELRAGGQRRQVAERVHGDDEHLEIRHAGQEGQVGDRLVVPEVEILDMRAVAELGGLGVIHNTALRGLGGEDLLHVRAHAVACAEPDAPHDLNVRELIAQLFHLLAGHAAAVHDEGLKARHAGQDLADLCAVVRHLAVVDVHHRVGGVQRHLVEREAEIRRSGRRGLAEPADFRPAQVLLLVLAGKMEGLEPRHAGEQAGGLVYAVRSQCAEVDLRVERRVCFAKEREAPVKVDLRVLRAQLLQLCELQRAEADLLHGGEIAQLRERVGELLLREGGEVERGIAALPRPAGQLHGVQELHLRMLLCPGEHLVIAAAAGEIGLLQVRIAVERGELLRVQHGDDLDHVRRVVRRLGCLLRHGGGPARFARRSRLQPAGAKQQRREQQQYQQHVPVQLSHSNCSPILTTSTPSISRMQPAAGKAGMASARSSSCRALQVLCPTMRPGLFRIYLK